MKNLIERIIKIDDFPGFYFKDECFKLNQSYNFCWVVANNILYSPYTSLEDIIYDAARYAFWSKYEWEDWDNRENDYFEQFKRWWDINKTEFVNNSQIRKIYDRVTTQRKKLKGRFFYTK